MHLAKEFRNFILEKKSQNKKKEITTRNFKKYT